MNRFRLLLLNEFKLARTALPIHLVAILQPMLMYLLMTEVLVFATFDMVVAQPATDEGRALVAAMREVGSPIGLPYINPIIVSPEEAAQMASSTFRQMITVESHDGVPTAVQRFSLIDSNQVKNLRNRLTAAALRLWNEALGDAAVTIEEHPWLPEDVPYTVYFGLAMLPMATFVGAVFIGGILTAQDFEFRTIGEFRLAPIAPVWILGARLVRLVLSAFLSAGAMVLALGWQTGYWPDSLWRVGLILLPIAIVGGSLGIIIGFVFRRSIPSLLTGLIAAIGSWILGGAFGLVSGFGQVYQGISRLTPNVYAVELLFPRYYGTKVGDPRSSILALALFSVGLPAFAFFAYRWRVLKQE
ncbi:MAG: ABC transporter permease [Anaerolineae bacterium]|nr:ABC transporter permease [Anaerolineae bacterium]